MTKAREKAAYEAEGYPNCVFCGARCVWADCWQCHGDGCFDLAGEDPVNLSRGEEYETCTECGGRGGYYEYPRVPHGISGHGG